MPAKQGARAALRTATAPYHERVDAAFSRADLSDAGSYGRFLTAQAAAHLPVEAALERSGVTGVLPDWPGRRRAALLRADLGGLELPVPEGDTAPDLPSPAAVLGAVYVLEGSRLGGRLLSRSLPGGMPRRFLDAADPSGWRRLIDTLDARLAEAAQVAAAVQAAAAVFALFEAAARRHLAAGG